MVGFPGGSGVKNMPAKVGDSDSIPGSGRATEERNGNPLPVFLSGKSHGQRSLAGYSPWGHKVRTLLSYWASTLKHLCGRCLHRSLRYISKQNWYKSLPPQKVQSSMYVCVCVRACMLTRIDASVVSDSLRPPGLCPASHLCPWDSPGKNNEVGSHSLLPGIFLTHGSNPGPLHCRQILHWLSSEESLPFNILSPKHSLTLHVFVTRWSFHLCRDIT